MLFHIDHVLRYRDIYRHADTLVFDVLVEHFVGYSVAFIRRVPNLRLTDEGIELAARFVSNGFAGAIGAWLRNPAITRDVLEDAVVTVAPAWWA